MMVCSNAETSSTGRYTMLSVISEIILDAAIVAGVFVACRHANRQRSWVTTTAQVCAVTSKENPDLELPGPLYFVDYAFTWEDRPFTGSGPLVLGVDYKKGREAVQRAAAQFVPGTPIRVYHSPKDPAQNSTIRTVLTFPLCCFFIAIGFMVRLVFLGVTQG